MAELAVDQERPHVAEGDLLIHQVFDVDTAVAQRAAVFIRFGDFGGEGDDAFEAGDKVFGDHSHAENSRTPWSGRRYRPVASAGSVDAMAGRHPEQKRAPGKECARNTDLWKRTGVPDLDAAWLDDGWVSLLRRWIDDAERSGVAEPNAMVLATVIADGRPASRSVLCKSVDETGITFFTNYDSAKGDDLAVTPYASATFPWYQLGRQVHVRGPVSKVDAQAIEDYWSKRPRGSQLGAWASHQSQPIASRAALLDQLAAVSARFADSRAGSGAAGLGWRSDRAGGGRVLAGTGKPVAQPHPGQRRSRRATSAVARGAGVRGAIRAHTTRKAHPHRLVA